MLKVQEYLQTHTLDDLKDQYKLKIRIYDDRIVLNYDQIESHKFKMDEIVRECRGLILDKNYNVLSRAFDRFFNYNEDPNTKDFDISSCTAYEKIDGSLMPVYFDGKHWNCSTKQLAFGELCPSSNGRSFKNIFTSALQYELDDAFKKCDPDYTYIFEMTSPFTRVVKPYDLGLYILSIRNKITGHEIYKQDDIKYMLKNMIGEYNYPKIFQFNNIDDVLKNTKELPPFDEGYVCCQNLDSHIWRLKIKNPSYLAIAHIKGEYSLSPKRILTLILKQEQDEYLSYFEEDRKHFQPYIDAYNYLFEELPKIAKSYSHIEIQKDLAYEIKDHPLKHVIFYLRYNNYELDNTYLEKLTEPGRIALFNNLMKYV